MSCTVGNVSDELLGSPFGSAELPVHDTAEQLYDVNIFPFVKPANIVGLSYFSMVKYLVNGDGMVFHIKPVTDVFPLPIDRQRLVVFDIIDTKRVQLLGKLVGPVVVGTVADDRVHFIRIGISSYKMVGRGLGGRVRGLGIIGSLFCKKTSIIQGSVHFIGRNMVKKVSLIILPEGFGSIEQVYSTDNIGSNESHRIGDTSVYMGFSSQMNHIRDLEVVEQLVKVDLIQNIHFGKTIIRASFDLLEVFQISRIRQSVQVDYLIVRVFLYKKLYHMGADKSCTASY